MHELLAALHLVAYWHQTDMTPQRPQTSRCVNEMSGTDIKTAAAISTYDHTNIDGGSCYFLPGMAQGFLVVRLARLAAQHPGLDIEVATDLRLVRGLQMRTRSCRRERKTCSLGKV